MKVLKRISRLVILWVTIGMCYATLELFWRGVTYLPMVFIGGLAGLCVASLDHVLMKRMWVQCLIYTVITIVIEFSSGCLLNLRLHMDIWDYSSAPLNLLGQVCLPYAALWFFLMPFAIWMVDWLRWKLFDDPPPKNGPVGNYIQLFKGK